MNLTDEYLDELVWIANKGLSINKTDALALIAALRDARAEVRHLQGILDSRPAIAAIRALIPETPSPAPSNRVTRDDDGHLDEIVTDGGCHLEHMGGESWFLACYRRDGSSVAVWLRGEVTLLEERDAP